MSSIFHATIHLNRELIFRSINSQEKQPIDLKTERTFVWHLAPEKANASPLHGAKLALKLLFIQRSVSKAGPLIAQLFAKKKG